MKIRLKPTHKQYEAWLALENHNIVFLGGGAGGGKSWWLCETRLVNAYRYPGYKSFIGREELKRLMASTFLTWCKVCKYHNIPQDDWKLNGQYNYIEFKNGSRIDLLDLKYLPSDPAMNLSRPCMAKSALIRCGPGLTCVLVNKSSKPTMCCYLKVSPLFCHNRLYREYRLFQNHSTLLLRVLCAARDLLFPL